MINPLYYPIPLIIFGPAAAYLLTSFYYTRKHSRDLLRQWNEQFDAEGRRRQMDRVIFEQQQQQREAKIRAEANTKAGMDSKRLDQLDQWKVTVEERLGALSAANNPEEAHGPEALS